MTIPEIALTAFACLSATLTLLFHRKLYSGLLRIQITHLQRATRNLERKLHRQRAEHARRNSIPFEV